MDVTYDGPAITLAGHLDGRSSAQVRQALFGALAARPHDDVVLDVSEVEWIDGTALRMLAAFSVRLDRDGRRLVLRGCTPALRRLLASTAWRPLFHLAR